MQPTTRWWKNIGQKRRNDLLNKYNKNQASAEFVQAMYQKEFTFPDDLDLIGQS